MVLEKGIESLVVLNQVFFFLKVTVGKYILIADNFKGS